MSKQRLLTLLLGVGVLALLTYFRLGSKESHPPATPVSPRQNGSQSSSSQARPIVAFAGRTMGTTYSVKYAATKPVPSSVAQTAVEAALEEVNATMSTYRPESEVSVFNRLAAGEPFPASPSLWEVLTMSREVFDKTDGAFDITVRPLVLAFGFGSEPNHEALDEGALSEIRQRVGMDLLVLNSEKRTLEKKRDGVQLDLGGVAKGYGVDRAAQALQKLGLSNYLVEVGGEIRVLGKKSNAEPWVLAIEEPRPDGRSLHGTLRLSERGAALATSGDYRNFRQIGGKTVSHTFDPRTGQPTPRRTASVSVIRPTAAEADALATALSVLTPEESIAKANENGWAVYLLVHRKPNGDTGQPGNEQGKRDFEFRQSTSFAQLNFKREADRQETRKHTGAAEKTDGDETNGKKTEETLRKLTE